MKTIGHAGRAVIATTGIEIPLQPRKLTAQEAAARAARVTAAIEAAENAAAHAADRPAAARSTAKRPAARRSAVHQTSAETAVQAAAETAPEKVASSSEVQQLRAELAAAGERIMALETRIREQAICISAAATDIDTSNCRAGRAEHLAREASDRNQVLLARAESAERDLAAAQAQIGALTRPAADVDDQDIEHVDVEVDDVVLCEGGCGVLVAAEFVAKTGLRRHSCCVEQPASPERRVAA